MVSSKTRFQVGSVEKEVFRGGHFCGVSVGCLGKSVRDSAKKRSCQMAVPVHDAAVCILLTRIARKSADFVLLSSVPTCR